MFIINFCLNMFRASLCPSSGEQRLCYCISCIVLILLDVVGSGCGALRCRMRALHVEREVNNKYLIVASSWFFCLHTLLTTHGHRNLKEADLAAILHCQQNSKFLFRFFLSSVSCTHHQREINCIPVLCSSTPTDPNLKSPHHTHTVYVL